MFKFLKILDMKLMINPFTLNICFALAAICFLLIWYKILNTHDGDFRKNLLWFFGMGGFSSAGCAFFYHPFYNIFLPFVLFLPFLGALIKLTLYLLINCGFGQHLYQHKNKSIPISKNES